MDEHKTPSDDALLDLSSKTDEELRATLDDLYSEEQRISYRRRVLHGKIDILRAELVRRLAGERESEVDNPSIDIDRLIEILSTDLRGVSRFDVTSDESDGSSAD